MPPFEPVLLANIGKPDSYTRAVYEQTGGYRSLRKVLADMSPAALIDLSFAKRANLVVCGTSYRRRRRGELLLRSTGRRVVRLHAMYSLAIEECSTL